MGRAGHPAFALSDNGSYRGPMSAGGATYIAIMAGEKWQG